MRGVMTVRARSSAIIGQDDGMECKNNVEY